MTLLYFVSGMFCGTCAKTVESRVRGLPQVNAAELSFGSRLLTVELQPGLEPELVSRLIEAEITSAGFGVRRQKDGWLGSFSEQLQREQAQVVPAWLLGTVVFFAMWASTAAFASYLGSLEPQEEYLLALLSTLVGTPALLLGAVPFARAGLRALWAAKLPTIDLFVALGSLSALALSYGNLLSGSSHTYVDSSAMILVLLLLAKVVEGKLAGVMVGRVLYGINGADPEVRRIAPTPRTVRASQVRRGDKVSFAAGETITVDGCLASPTAAVDSHLLSGEQAVVNLHEGAPILAGSIARSELVLEVSDPVGNRLIDGWAEAALTSTARPHRYSQLLQSLESRLTTFALGGASALGMLRYQQTGALGEAAEAFFVGVLIFCPCLFASILPLAKQMAHLALARRGLFCQRAESLFDLAGIDNLVFDKTGTLESLESHFLARDSVLAEPVGRLLDELRRHTYHPVLDGLPPVSTRWEASEPPQLEVVAGQGVSATWNALGACLVVGRASFVAERLREPLGRIGRDAHHDDRTLVGYNGRWAGEITSGQSYDQRALQALGALRPQLPENGSISVLSGDPKPLSPHLRALFEELGIAYRGGLLPAEKAAALPPNALFVGDGLNDTPALAQATVSLRVGSRARGFTPVDLQLLEPDLARVGDLLTYARRFTTVLRQTALMAALYNLVAWTLAALGYFTPLGAVLAMLTSLSLMTLSSLRLLR